jgi:hypothetical protein
MPICIGRPSQQRHVLPVCCEVVYGIIPQVTRILLPLPVVGV